MQETRWIDIDWTVGEEVMVLQPDRTWKRYSGQRFELQLVDFEGTPEAVAEEVQALRDSVEWDDVHFCKVDGMGIAARSDGTVSVHIGLYLTNGARGYNVLRSLKMVVLDLIAKSMLTMRNNAQEVLLNVIAERATQDMQKEEDERFLRQVETAIRAHRERRSCADAASSRDEP